MRPPEHRARPSHDANAPVHVTLRVRADIPRLRQWPVLTELRAVLRLAAKPTDFRAVHASLQSDHLELIVEADSGEALLRGMQGIATSLGRRINRLHARKGRVFWSRSETKDLTNPAQMRAALAFVLQTGASTARTNGVGALGQAPK